jgi:hypothetical protein
MVKRQWGSGIDRAFNLTIKKSKWEWEGERVGNPAPVTKITINQRWQTSRTQWAIMVGQASEVRGEGEDGKGEERNKAPSIVKAGTSLAGGDNQG